MTTEDDLQRLGEEAANPEFWFWKRHGESTGSQRVRSVLEVLDGEAHHSELARAYAQSLREKLEEVRVRFIKEGHAEAAEAIASLLGPGSSDEGFKVVDPELEDFTATSSQSLIFPKMVDFVVSQGGVLQSAREAVVYRLLLSVEKAKEDLQRYYLTRTAALYFKNDGRIWRFPRGASLVAFDDDPFDNILLTATEEGRRAGGSWLVDVSRVTAAIARAERTGRIIDVRNSRERSDPLDVGKCIIGDKTARYNEFLQHHLKRNLRAWVLETSDCRNLSESQVLIRCVRVGVYGYVGYDYLGADVDLRLLPRPRGAKNFFQWK